MSTTRKALTFDIDRSPVPSVPAPAPKSTPKPSRQAEEPRQQLGARVTADVYRQLKVRAAMRNVKIQDLLEQAIIEYLANHPD